MLKPMEHLVQLRQRAEAENKVIDVTGMNLETGLGARIVARPTRGNKVVDGILMATTAHWIEQAKPVFGL